MIPPLIPLPNDKQTNMNTTTMSKDAKEDLFSTLFSPSTPRASPTLEPLADSSLPHVPSRPPLHHARTASVDSEFGSFVSVPAAEHPLTQSPSFEAENVPFTPLQNIEFFDRFTDDAKTATARSKKGVLDELLEHEDDPLYFLKEGGHASGTSTPIPTKPTTPEAQEEEDPLDWLQETTSKSNELSETSSISSEGGLYMEPSPSRSEDDRQSRHPSRQHNQTEPQSMLSSFSPLVRSPSLPPSPTRISVPEIQRAQSFFTPSSLSSASSFPTRWMSSLLSRPTVNNRPSISRTLSSEDTATHLPHPAVSVPRPISPATEMHTHSRSRTMSVASSFAPEITHGTPFASHPYIPPSGAPGFAGDRTWNTGGFEFDKERVEKKSVRLIGRKDVTSPVLTAELADMLRPHFPALSRLPRSWTLLYSLDQHGISLHTLYTRCDSHQGGTLVIMRDSNDAVFGAWMGEGIHPSKGAYYGSGESFLWKELPDHHHVKIYKWTGKNDYFALCESDYISFGGGDGKYGLYLDETLSDGSSARCPTFDNDPLCSVGPRQGGGVRFECVGLEVWGVG